MCIKNAEDIPLKPENSLCFCFTQNYMFVKSWVPKGLPLTLCWQIAQKKYDTFHWTKYPDKPLKEWKSLLNKKTNADILAHLICGYKIHKNTNKTTRFFYMHTSAKNR